MVLLALGDLESPVELLGKDKSCHQMGKGDVAEADPSVGAGADFR